MLPVRDLFAEGLGVHFVEGAFGLGDVGLAAGASFLDGHVSEEVVRDVVEDVVVLVEVLVDEARGRDALAVGVEAEALEGVPVQQWPAESQRLPRRS